MVQPNIVVCPHCATEFENNRVNGMALVETVSAIEARKRMHCRLSLDALEKEFGGEIPKPVKKIVLDGYNDLSRDAAHILGFGEDVE